MPQHILPYFALDPANYTIMPFGPGLINHTFKVSGSNGDYILQEINSHVFKSPHDISGNLAALKSYFINQYPDYLFVAPISTINNELLVTEQDGKVWRLFPFVEGSYTIDFVDNEKQAFEAARQFGKFTKLLNDFKADQLAYTLTDFHNLTLRFEQFEKAVSMASMKRSEEAADEISAAYAHREIVKIYNRLMQNSELPLRVIHHDTKISNILFDKEQNGICVIDLDTVMPGYYLSDVGDMMRTYLSPANEEETELEKVYVREEIFKAICKGYLSEMAEVLTDTEKQQFIFSGKMMIYMQALRFLTDFLNNDVYYGSRYQGHNLVRAKNQFKLLSEYVNAENNFNKIISHYSAKINY